MEFPDLGEHCSEKTCKRLDFLPMRCDACQEIFCKDHITYANHKCTSSYKKDIQVPVCPLCNIPIPIKRGEMPDIKVGEHIDRDCKSDPAQRKRKLYPADPHFSFSTECNSTINIISGRDALRSRRIWLSLRLSLPVKKNTDASSRDNRYPESLAVTSMLTGTHVGEGVQTVDLQPFLMSDHHLDFKLC
eukprot:superscaffoldBa00000184_g2495